MGGDSDKSGYSLSWFENNLRIELQNTSKKEKKIVDNPVQNDGKWHHFAFTWSKKDKKIITYIDGAKAQKTLIFNGPIGNSTINLNFGRNENNSDLFKGYIDEGRVISEVLSADQICTEYNNQNNPADFFTTDEEEENECTSNLKAGTATASSTNINARDFVVLSLKGQSKGIAIQWESSEDNISFSGISGGNLSRLKTTPLNTTTFFRVKVDNGICIIYSNTVSIEIKASFLALYGHRKKVTIDKSMVSGDENLENFPVLISFTDEDLKSKEYNGNVYRSNVYDIVFADEKGNILHNEKEKYNAPTGNLVAWVNIPKLNNKEDQTFYIYYGSCDGSTNSNPSSKETWPNKFKGIWHLTGNYLDATSNGNKGSNKHTSNHEEGKIADARYFNGSNSYLDMGNNKSLFINDEITVSAWAKSTGGNGHLVNMGGGENDPDYSLFWFGDDIRKELQSKSSKEKTNVDNPAPKDGNWHHIVFTWDKKSKLIRTYIDGIHASKTTSFKGPIGDPKINLNIGRKEKSNHYFKGYIDEPRVLNSRLSGDWITTEYNNQNTPKLQY